MTSILNVSDISLEEDRFEVDCWRYVGEPVAFGSRGNTRSLRVGGLDSGKGSAGSTNEGWFGVSLWSGGYWMALMTGIPAVEAQTEPYSISAKKDPLGFWFLKPSSFTFTLDFFLWPTARPAES